MGEKFKNITYESMKRKKNKTVKKDIFRHLILEYFYFWRWLCDRHPDEETVCG